MAETLDFILFIQQEMADIMTRWRAHQAARTKPVPD